MARHGDPPPRGRRGFPAVRGGDGPLRRLPPVGEPQGGLHRGGRVQAARPPSATCRPTAGSSHPRSRWASPVALPSWGRGSCRSRGSPGSAGTATAWPASRPRGVMWRRPPSWTRPAAGPASSPAAGLAVPLVTVRHQLYITEPIAGVLPLQPIGPSPRADRLRALRRWRGHVRGLRGRSPSHPAGIAPTGVPGGRPGARHRRSPSPDRRGGRTTFPSSAGRRWPSTAEVSPR